MSRNAKPNTGQGAPSHSRHGWARGLKETALGEANGAFLRAGFTDPTLVLRWTEIAGAAVARIARPFKWQEDKEGATLTLKCEPGAVVLLQHQTRELMERVNAYAGRGRVTRLKLLAGRLDELPGPADHPRRFSPLEVPTDEPPPLPAALERMTKLRRGLRK